MATVEIKCFKLVSGEEIVGTVTYSHTDYVLVEKPLHIALAEQGYVTMPFMPFVDKAIQFSLSAMSVKPVSVTKKMEESYLSQTSSIQIAPAGSLIQLNK